jgi:hypothetical protein
MMARALFAIALAGTLATVPAPSPSGPAAGRQSGAVRVYLPPAIQSVGAPDCAPALVVVYFEGLSDDVVPTTSWSGHVTLAGCRGSLAGLTREEQKKLASGVRELILREDLRIFGSRDDPGQRRRYLKALNGLVGRDLFTDILIMGSRGEMAL